MKRGSNPVPGKNVDEYMKALPSEERVALEKIRKIVRATAPKAEECIRFSMPSYKYNGPLVNFAAYENHCAFYVINKEVLKVFAKELEPFESTGHTIHFTPSHPLPDSLIKKIVKFRVKNNEGKLEL